MRKVIDDARQILLTTTVKTRNGVKKKKKNGQMDGWERIEKEKDKKKQMGVKHSCSPRREQWIKPVEKKAERGLGPDGVDQRLN